MNEFQARPVFFVTDAEHALAFYTGTLGFSLDWNHEVDGRAYVLQVSLAGIELILNQVDVSTRDRAGHGRLFVGLDDHGSQRFRRHLAGRSVATTVVEWGSPTLAIRDPDGNELFFWFPESEREKLHADFGGG